MKRLISEIENVMPNLIHLFVVKWNHESFVKMSNNMGMVNCIALHILGLTKYDTTLDLLC
jgi:hypothetical protein